MKADKRQISSAQRALATEFQTRAEQIFQLMLAQPVVSGEELYDFLATLKSGKFVDLSRLRFSATKEAAAPKAKARAKASVREVKVKNGSIPPENKAIVHKGQRRTLITYTPEQQEAQMGLIYRTVSKNQREITTPQIIKAVQDAYPEIKDNAVREKIKHMVESKMLKIMTMNEGPQNVAHFALGTAKP